MSGLGALLLIVVIALIPMILIALVILRLYRKAPPNIAMIISGGRGPKVIIGKGTVVIPGLQRVDYISLEPIRVEMRLADILTKDNAKVEIDAVAIVKVDSSSEEAILKAAERFLGKTKEEVISMVRDIFEKGAREVAEVVTADELLHQRTKIAYNIEELIRPDLSEMGLELSSFEIRRIRS